MRLYETTDHNHTKKALEHILANIDEFWWQLESEYEGNEDFEAKQEEFEDASDKSQTWIYNYLHQLVVKFQTTVMTLSDNNSIKIYRAVSVSNNWDISKQPLGIYWSWDEESADAYWGGHGDVFIIHAIVKMDDVDWVKTIYQNVLYSDEKEITVKAGSNIDVQKIVDYDGNTKEINGVFPA